MLSEEQIKKGLHASRVVSVSVPNPHGPLGMEHLAQVVAQIQGNNGTHATKAVHPLEVPLATWLKLEELADATAKTAARPVSVSEVAVAILQDYFSK